MRRKSSGWCARTIRGRSRARDGGDDLLIWRAAVSTEGSRGASREPSVLTAAPGTIIGLKPDATVQCGDGALALLEVQAPGRRRMAAADYLRGRRVAPGARLGS